MKKTPLLILFGAAFLTQIAFPLKTIANQYMARKYGAETLEDVKICNRYYSGKFENEHYVDLGGKGEFFLKKDAVKIIKSYSLGSKEYVAKLKVKTLGGKRSIEDLILEGVALKNASAEDLKLLEERLSKLPEAEAKPPKKP